MAEVFVGIDNGFGNTKGVHSLLPSGVRQLSTKPPVLTNVVEFDGKFYAVGIPKSDIEKSKTENEHTLIASLAIIAKELNPKGLTNASVRLGVGVPLTRMGAEKNDLQAYFMKHRRIDFRFEGKKYNIFIVSADVMPQGYAAVASRLDELPLSTVVVDIGSWTVDILPIVEGIPDLSKCKSLPNGTITAVNEINERLRQKFNGEADMAVLKEIMTTGISSIDKGYLNEIQSALNEYSRSIFDILRALKFNMDLSNFIFIGGGAYIIKNFSKELPKNTEIVLDININAKGYEELLSRKYKAVSA